MRFQVSPISIEAHRAKLSMVRVMVTIWMSRGCSGSVRTLREHEPQFYQHRAELRIPGHNP